MNLLANNQQKLNDIIFANKNKKYGAYAIRTEYDSSVAKSLIIVFSLAMLFALTTYILNRTKEEERIKIQDITNIADPVKTIVMDIEQMFQKKPVASTPNKPTGGAKGETHSTVISDTVAKETSTVLNNVTVSTSTSALTSTNTGIPFTGSTTTGGGGGTITTGGGDNGPVLFSEEMPEYEGGLGAIKSFIAKNISYPQKAIDLEKEGTVRVSFVVNETGNVVDVKVADGIGAGCDEEAVRVVSKLPKFKKPGKNAGKAVKVMFYIPIKFKLQK